MQNGSPDWLTAKFQDGRHSLETILTDSSSSKAKRALFTFLFFATFVLVWGSTYILYRQFVPPEVHFRINKIYFLYPIVGSLVFFWSLIFTDATKPLSALPLYLLTLSLLSFEGDFSFSPWLFTFHSVLLASTILIFQSIRESASRIKLAVVVFYSLFVIALENYLAVGWSEFENLLMGYPQRYFFILYLAFMNEQSHDTDQSTLFKRNILHPTQLLYPIPTQPYYWEAPASEARVKNRARGLVDLMICAILAYLLLQLQTLELGKEENEWLRAIRSGTIGYLILYLYSCIGISLPVAAARLMGYNLPNAYEMPLLAASPQDRWRRWNTYFYQFYMWVFYLPVFRKTKSLFLSVILTFVVTAFFHIRLVLPTTALVQDAEIDLPRKMFVFFLMHALVVYAGLKLKLPIWNGKTILGWTGVLVTWLAMIAIHSFRF